MIFYVAEGTDWRMMPDFSYVWKFFMKNKYFNIQRHSLDEVQ